MKKFSLALLALATALAFSSTAKADSLTIGFTTLGQYIPAGSHTSSGYDIFFSGTLYGTQSPTGTWTITSGSISVNGAAGQTGLTTGTATLVSPVVPVVGQIAGKAPTGTPDNIVTQPVVVGGALTPVVDYSGLLFQFANGEYLNVFAGDPVYPFTNSLPDYGIYEESATKVDYQDFGSLNVTFPQIGQSPEPGSLMLLGTGLLALAFVAFRKNSGAAFNL
jgi:hypothetical protein